MRCTALLSKNLPHGHLNIQYYELGGGNSPHITSEENPEMERGEARRYEQTYDGGPDSIAARERRIRIPVSFITGVKKVSPNEKQLTLRLYTKDDTYRITFERDTDYKNWFDSLNDYIRFCHHVPQVPPSQSVWALTSDGDVYFSPPAPSCVTDHSKRPWLPIEGNIIQVTAGPRQVVWGLTPDFELYYFTKGYGGGDMPLGERLENCSITRRFEIRENQRYKILNQQFLACGNNDKRDHWVDRSGNKVESDNQYSPKSGMGARKRYKYRIGRLEVRAPWKKIPTQNVTVKRVALEQYRFAEKEEPLAAWALCSNGLLYREGVTSTRPEGTNWVIY
eukprot:sb/3466547/